MTDDAAMPIDGDWFSEDESGGVVKRLFSYAYVAANGEVKEVTRTLDIRVLSGIEYGDYQEALMHSDKDGEIRVDIKAGQEKLVMLSLGWSKQQVDEVKRRKPMSCWSAINEAVSAVNRVGSTKVIQTEKNGDGVSSAPPSP